MSSTPCPFSVLFFYALFSLCYLPSSCEQAHAVNSLGLTRAFSRVSCVTFQLRFHSFRYFCAPRGIFACSLLPPCHLLPSPRASIQKILKPKRNPKENVSLCFVFGTAAHCFMFKFYIVSDHEKFGVLTQKSTDLP